MDGKHGEVMGARVSPVLQIVPFKRFCIQNYVFLYKICMYIERGRRGRGKGSGIVREHINFPFRLFSPPPSALFGTATQATRWSASSLLVDNTKRRVE